MFCVVEKIVHYRTLQKHGIELTSFHAREPAGPCNTCPLMTHADFALSSVATFGMSIGPITVESRQPSISHSWEI